MVLVVIAMASILLMGALALDGGHMLLNKTRLQNAVDAAALSGAKTLQLVTGSGNSSSLTRDAALNTLRLNADADGNGELSDGIGGDGVGAFAIVELSNSVYGPFSYPGPADAAYVRVTVPDYPLVGFLWGVVNMFGSGDLEKAVAAIATAGPSPSTNPCRIEPIMVCGDPDQYDPANGNFWGYGFGDPVVLKGASGSDPAIGPGNFQLLRLGDSTGANDLRDDLAGGIDKCNVVGEEAETEPGNTVGPVAQGLNTRLGVYTGNMSADEYPPDWVTDFTSPRTTYDDTTSDVEYEGEVVTSSDGNLSTSSADLFDYNDWQTASAACAASGTCQGAYERRILTLVMGNCDGASGGQTSVPVLGFGCFYLLQTVKQSGVEAHVFGQFISECEGDGTAGATPADDVGPNIIQLYKTYFSGVATPSPDS
jgi:hypothetical protein